MRFGYIQIRHKNQSGRNDIENLNKSSCQYVYVESYREKNKEMIQKRELLKLLRESHKGDTIVLTDLDHLGRNYLECLELLKIIKKYGLELEILVAPNNRLVDWDYVLNWVKNQVEGKESTIRVKKFSKERGAEKAQYRFFAKDPYYRRVYRQILQQVMSKRSLREITKETNAPLGTVVRIRKDYEKLKQTTLLVGTFFLTIISLKMAQAYSTNPVLQVAICGVMTALIIYFSYSDSQSD